MYLRIAHIGDIHVSGKSYFRATSALQQAKKIILEKGVNTVVLSGDIFDTGNISDRFHSVGDLQAIVLEFIEGLPRVYALEGNHDQIEGKKSAITFLKGCPNVRVINKFTQVDNLIFVPWESRKEGYKLGEVRQDPDYTMCLFGHMDILGHEANKHYTVENSKFGFPMKDLEKRAEFIQLGHIHKRGGPYVGVLYQRHFGEEGYPQGFEIITLRKGKRRDNEYVEINLPTFKTIEIKAKEDKIPVGGIRKLRFYCQEAYQEKQSLIRQGDKVELLFKKRQVKRRRSGASEVKESNDIKGLLFDYVKDTPPQGISVDRVMEEVG